MKKKELKVFPYTLPMPKGMKMDTKSETIQHDSMSIKDMIRNHVQGVLDPNEYNEGLYDPEGIDHEDDVQERSQKTLLDALDYANENKMTQTEIEDFIDTFGHESIPNIQTDQESLKTSQNESLENDGQRPTDISE